VAQIPGVSVLIPKSSQATSNCQDQRCSDSQVLISGIIGMCSKPPEAPKSHIPINRLHRPYLTFEAATNN
jgi:hypothetical protein